MVTILNERLLQHCADLPGSSLTCKGLLSYGSTSFKILSNLDSILVERAFDFLVKGFVLVINEINIIAEIIKE